LGALSTLHQLHAEEQFARKDFLVRDQCLLDFRSTLDVYGNRIDEYFLDTNADVQSRAANDFASLVRRIHVCLNSYPSQRGQEEREFLESVQNLIAAQQETLNTAMKEDRQYEPERISRLLYQEALPRNRQLIAATERVELWNHSRMDAGSAAAIQTFAGLERHLTRLLVLMLSSGLLLSIGSIAYILKQDREARVRYAELV
jgi:hypothetical protein